MISKIALSIRKIVNLKFQRYVSHKVIEVMANSDKSWEDAAQQAVTEAAKSLHNIRSVYIKDHSATVENNKITGYRITAKISFLNESL
jgi:flavin-binding protein dodecin